MSIWPFVIGIVLILPIFPASRILQRAGFSRLWAIVYIIPIVNLIVLFMFAYSDWPNEAKA